MLPYKLPSNKRGTGTGHLYLRITQGLLCTASVASKLTWWMLSNIIPQCIFLYRRHSLQKCFIKLYRTFSCDILKSMWSDMWRFTEAHVIILLMLVYSSNKDLASMQHDMLPAICSILQPTTCDVRITLVVWFQTLQYTRGNWKSREREKGQE